SFRFPPCHGPLVEHRHCPWYKSSRAARNLPLAPVTLCGLMRKKDDWLPDRSGYPPQKRIHRMGWKTILLPLSLDEADDSGIGWAAEFAQRMQARLMGLAVAGLKVTVHRGMSPLAASEKLKEETQALEARLARLGEHFRAIAGEEALWRGMIGDALLILPE